MGEALCIIAGAIAVAWGVARWLCWVCKSQDRGEERLGTLLRVDMMRPMGIGEYAWAIGGMTVAIALWVAALLYLQPVPPQPSLVAHIAIAAATHTNWQPYAIDKVLTPTTQTLGIGVAMMLAGAISLAVWRVLIRTLNRQPIGNAWGDIYRMGIWVILPLQLILALILAWQGVSAGLWGGAYEQGPVASFAAGKIVSGAGAGYSPDNYIGKLENPNATTNMAGLWALIGVPLGVVWASGRMLMRPRMGVRWMVAIAGLLIVAVALATPQASPQDRHSPISQAAWLVATSGSGNGSQNIPLERLNPIKQLVPTGVLLWGIPLPPAIGTGTAAIIFYMIFALYIAGLMIGRSPSLLGWRIGAPHITAAALAILGPGILILIATGGYMLSPEGTDIVKEQGAYGVAVIMHTMATTTYNNGSGYSLVLDKPVALYITMGLMIAGRVVALGAILWLAGLLAVGRDKPVSATLIEEDSAEMITAAIVIILSAALTMIGPMMLGGILYALG